MAERAGKAIGLEGPFELQKDFPKNQNKTCGLKKNVVTNVRSVVEEKKQSGAGTAAWKEGDKEMIGKSSLICGH